MKNGIHFLFQQSKIFEAGDPIDPQGAQRLVRARTEIEARRKLPHPGTGRAWVLVSQEKEEK